MDIYYFAVCQNIAHGKVASPCAKKAHACCRVFIFTVCAHGEEVLYRAFERTRQIAGFRWWVEQII